MTVGFVDAVAIGRLFAEYQNRSFGTLATDEETYKRGWYHLARSVQREGSLNKMERVVDMVLSNLAISFLYLSLYV